MSSRQPRTVLVLGGIRSGKSEFAETLVGSAGSVRYVATATLEAPIGSATDAVWAGRIAAHRDRRPEHWSTEEIGKAPEELAALVAAAGADETLLVDDIGGWLAALLASTTLLDQGVSQTTAADQTPRGAVTALAAAVAASPARIVLVTPEVGLSVIPATPLGRAFADACGEANRALAEACDGVVLVVAGQPTWLKAVAGRLPESVVVTPAATARARPPVAVQDFEPGSDVPETQVGPGMQVPLPDHEATTAATDHVNELAVPGPGLGAMTAAVTFAAGTQGSGQPEPFRSVRVMHIYGQYAGGIAAGDAEALWASRLSATRAGSSAMARLAATAGATIELINAGDANALEDGNASTGDEITEALHRGWQAANAAVDRGDDLIVLAAGGPGIDAAAATVVAALTAAEVPSLLGRVWQDGGRIDDDAWMTRCIVARDALRNLRASTGPAADGPKALAALGGPALATATGVLLGAAARRTPVLLDGPVGTAAALVAREYAAQARLWCLLIDHGHHPTARVAADMLSLEPLVDLRIGLGEGATALAVLPLIQSALLISSSVLTSDV